ncbi:MAG: hypothetical protein AB1410_07865 [Acidobacteriota bacterium]
MRNKLILKIFFLTSILSVISINYLLSTDMVNVFTNKYSCMSYISWKKDEFTTEKNKNRNFGEARLTNESTYILWYIMKGKAYGRILFIIPFRVYYENFASLILKTRKNSDGTTEFRYVDIGFPGYLFRTIDFMGHEIHIRIASHSLEESLYTGRKILINWVDEYPEFSRVIKPEKRKALPFGFDVDDPDNFSFLMDENGLVIPDSVRTRINPQYLWTAKDEIPLAAYGALTEALKFFSRPFTPNGNIEDLKNLPEEWLDNGLDFTYDFNKIGRMLEQVIRDFVVFHQEKPFSVRYYLKEKENGIFKIRGEAFPNVEIWSGYHITSYIREVEWDEKNMDIIRESLRMELYSKKGRGGYGIMELKKIE